MKRKPLPKPQYYVVINQDGLVFSGMKHGKFEWDCDWNNAKPLESSSTQYLLRENKCELIKQEEIL
jgi:hypothetical protein